LGERDRSERAHGRRDHRAAAQQPPRPPSVLPRVRVRRRARRGAHACGSQPFLRTDPGSLQAVTLRFVHARADELAPYAESLAALERSIEYPIADGADTFRIDHGPGYERFFSTLGEAHFLLALEGDRVVGTIAGILRDADLRGKKTRVAYVADMKVAE